MHQSFDIITVLREHALGAFAFDFGRYAVAAFGMAAIVWVLRRTRFASRKIQSREATMSDMRRELLASAQTCIVYISITVVMIWGIGAGVFQRIEGSRGLWIDIAILIAYITAHDAYFDWVHRAMHSRVQFKTFHRHHHRSITPTPFAAYSFALPEAFVMAAFVPLWQLFVATPIWVLVFFLTWQILRTVMGHSGIELFPRWWLSSPVTRWINTTTHHDLHHNGGFNTDYGLYFTWWDRMMGTEHREYHARFTEVVGRTHPASADGNTQTTPAAA